MSAPTEPTSASDAGLILRLAARYPVLVLAFLAALGFGIVTPISVLNALTIRVTALEANAKLVEGLAVIACLREPPQSLDLARIPCWQLLSRKDRP